MIRCLVRGRGYGHFWPLRVRVDGHSTSRRAHCEKVGTTLATVPYYMGTVRPLLATTRACRWAHYDPMCPPGKVGTTLYHRAHFRWARYSHFWPLRVRADGHTMSRCVHWAKWARHFPPCPLKVDTVRPLLATARACRWAHYEQSCPLENVGTTLAIVTTFCLPQVGMIRPCMATELGKLAVPSLVVFHQEGRTILRFSST